MDARMLGLAQQMATMQARRAPGRGGSTNDAYINQPRGGGGAALTMRPAFGMGDPMRPMGGFNQRKENIGGGFQGGPGFRPDQIGAGLAPAPLPSQGYGGARPQFGGVNTAQLGPPTGMQVPAPGGMPSMAKPMQGGIGGGGQVQPLEDFQWGARPMIRPPGR